MYRHGIMHVHEKMRRWEEAGVCSLGRLWTCKEKEWCMDARTWIDAGVDDNKARGNI